MEAHTLDLSKLKQLIDQHFDLDEVRSLCFDLRVDFDNLATGPKFRKIESLINHLISRNRLSDLVRMGNFPPNP